ncbi:hypothetical protein DFJ63DRAFT_311933 [Scheffersomyces coipomensis]|uniref:uncharacterized protein n=1 Tax=Scheffersomyces coipomensis TaxID=1788519 RepID=UPI00315D26F8
MNPILSILFIDGLLLSKYKLLFWCLSDRLWKLDVMIKGKSIHKQNAIKNYPSNLRIVPINYILSPTMFAKSDPITAGRSISQYDFIITSDQRFKAVSNSYPTIIYIDKVNLDIETISHGILTNNRLHHLRLVQYTLKLSLQYSQPLVLMVSTKKKDIQQDEDDDEVEEIDDTLKELMIGREHLTYGDEEVFFDADTPPPREAMSATVSELQNSTSQNMFVESPQINSSSSLSLNYAQYPPMMNFPNSAPVQVKTLHDEQGNTYVLQSNGFVIPVSRPSSMQLNLTNPILKKKKSIKKNMFYHMPIPTNRYTPTEKLVESHNRVLQLVQFDEFLDQTSTSRYRDLDTSSFILHSAGNSSKDTSSKGSSSKNGSFKTYDTAPEVDKESKSDP